MKRILLLLILVLISVSSTSHYKVVETEKEEVENLSFLNENLCDSVLYLALQYYEVKFPREVLAQAKLESGNYTSYHCRVKNNFLGLYNSKKKQYFKFDHWTDCILAYKSMIEYKHRDGEDYYQFLERIGYAEDPQYIYKVQKIEKTLTI